MEKQFSTGIIPFGYFMESKVPPGSTFLRASGLAKNSEDFNIWEHGQLYDQLIFQKAYWPEMMRLFPGPKVLDLCDPDWISGYVDIIEIGQLVDAITCSSENLSGLISSYFPGKMVVHVPDRLDFRLFPAARPCHRHSAKELIWFGYTKNAEETLRPLAEVIKEGEFNLTLIADRPYGRDDEIKALKPGFIQFDPMNAYQLIANADIILNPRSEKPLFKYKSNNKSIIGWKLGVAVAENAAELQILSNPVERNEQVLEKKAWVDQNYYIERSAEQYRSIFNQIRQQKK